MPQNAGQIIEQSFLRAKFDAERERMEEAENRLSIYMDDYEAIIQEEMQAIFAKDTYNKLKDKVNQSQNILKRIVNEISTIYKAEAKRVIEPASDRYEELQKINNYDLKMRRANRFTNLLNECLIKVDVRDGQIVYDFITPHICMVIQDDKDPTRAKAIIYQITWVDTRSKADIDYHYWSDEGDYFIFDKHWKIKEVIYEGNSPYKDKKRLGKFILPFVIFHRQEPLCNFWDRDSGRDLYNAATTIGVKMTLFDDYFHTASFKQIYMIGDATDMPQEQRKDPDTIMTVPPGEGAAIGTLDIQANLEDMKQAVMFGITSIMNNYGISSDQWTLSFTELSGVALRIRMQPLDEIRREQIPLYRRYERELFEITRMVNNAWASKMKWKKIPETTKFAVDFGDVTFPEDAMQRFGYRTKLMQSGLISLGQYYQDFNPDVKDEKEAEKLIIENLKSLQEIRVKYPELDDFLNTIFKITESSAETGGEGSEGVIGE